MSSWLDLTPTQWTREETWEEDAPNWEAIFAWVDRKGEDVRKEQDGLDQLIALRNILQRMISISIEQSITSAIEQEYFRLCQHSKFHIGGDGWTLRCCIYKRLFNEMLGELPTLPPVRKQSEHREYED
jgi:hypothetical protein